MDDISNFKNQALPTALEKNIISKVDHQLSMQISHKASKSFLSTLIASSVTKRHFQKRLCFCKLRLVSWRAASALRQSKTNEVASLQRILIRFVYKHHCIPTSGSLEINYVTGHFTFFDNSGGNGGR